MFNAHVIMKHVIKRLRCTSNDRLKGNLHQSLTMRLFVFVTQEVSLISENRKNKI